MDSGEHVIRLGSKTTSEKNIRAYEVDHRKTENDYNCRVKLIRATRTEVRQDQGIDHPRGAEGMINTSFADGRTQRNRSVARGNLLRT